MKKLKKIIIIIYIMIACLIIFLSKDYIIRQYFIRKIENVDYDEYIITTSYNGKKKDIAYYTDEFCMIRNYDLNGNLSDIIKIYDYTKNVQYYYYINEFESDLLKSSIGVEYPVNINNKNLLNCLKNSDETVKKFYYSGKERIDNENCYVLYFEKKDNSVETFYLSTKYLYVLKEILYNPTSNEIEPLLTKNYIVAQYKVDFDLKRKDLFEINFE